MAGYWAAALSAAATVWIRARVETCERGSEVARSW